jgi:hypothetical protein
MMLSRRYFRGQVQWFTHVIPVVWELEIGRIEV